MSEKPTVNHTTVLATASIPWPHCRECGAIEPRAGWTSQCHGAPKLRSMEAYKPPPDDAEMVQAFVVRKWGFRLHDDKASEIVTIIAEARRQRLEP